MTLVLLVSLTGNGVSPAGFAVQDVCSAAAECGRLGWRKAARAGAVGGGHSSSACDHSTCECLGKEMHLLISECDVDTCSWTRKQPLFLMK